MIKALDFFEIVFIRALSHRVWMVSALVVLISSSGNAGFWDDVWDNHVSPTYRQGFDQKGLIILGSGALAIAAMQPHDYEMRATWSNYQRMTSDQAQWGDWVGGGLGSAVIAATQLVFDRDNGIAHTEALLNNMLATGLLKELNQRGRPNSDNKLSMPSGHTSTSFATATALSYAYGLKVALPAYAAAMFVACSRLSADAHWASDTLAGATLGIFFGRATALHHMPLQPLVWDDGLGINWTHNF